MKDNKPTHNELTAKLLSDIERAKIMYYEDTTHYIKTQLTTFETKKEKVKFLKDFLRNKINSNEDYEIYIRKNILNIAPEIGVKIINFVFDTPNKIDKVNDYINREIEYHSSIDYETEIEIIPEEIQQRIAWLYSIGIIDYIKEKHKTHSPSTIGKILSKGTGVKWNTIKKTIERIESENLLEKYSDYINNTCQQLKIQRVK